MNKIVLIIFLIVLVFFLNVYGQSENKVNAPAFLKGKEFISFETDSNHVASFKNLLVEKNLISNSNNSITNFKTYTAVLKDDSIKMYIKHIEFDRIIEAYEFICNFFLLGDEKILNIGWLSVQLNDSMAISWYDKGAYIFSYPQQKNKKLEKLLKKILLPTDKFKNIPNFIKVFPEDDMIKNSLKLSTSTFLQQEYFTQTYYADYESKGSISRVYIVPVLRDSILIHFQKFREFWKNRGLLVEQEVPVESPYFVAQDVFLGRMMCVLYQDYIIGIMNYPSVDWTKEYLEKIRENLKKYPVYIE